MLSAEIVSVAMTVRGVVNGDAAVWRVQINEERRALELRVKPQRACGKHRKVQSGELFSTTWNRNDSGFLARDRKRHRSETCELRLRRSRKQEIESTSLGGRRGSGRSFRRLADSVLFDELLSERAVWIVHRMRMGIP